MQRFPLSSREVALRKLLLRNTFLERLSSTEWGGPFETTFRSLGNLRLHALHGVLRRSAQELFKAHVS